MVVDNDSVVAGTVVVAVADARNNSIDIACYYSAISGQSLARHQFPCSNANADD